jgi:hypothetical protein
MTGPIFDPLLLGFAIAGFRSFGAPVQYFGPLSKVTLLAGQNNSGKSNVLAFVSQQLPTVLKRLKDPDGYALSGLDVPQGGDGLVFRTALPIKNDDASIRRFLSPKVKQGQGLDPFIEQTLKLLLLSEPFNPSNGVSWLPVEPSLTTTRGPVGFPGEFLTILGTKQDRVGNTSYGVPVGGWQRLWSFLTQQGAGDLVQHWIPGVLSQLCNWSLFEGQIRFVPAFRQMTSDVQVDASSDGKGLIRSLGRLERPSFDRIGDQQKFKRIVGFVRDVLQRQDVDLEVPNEQTTIHIRIGDRVLPLSHLGTGIHQVVMLAANATLNDGVVICLEEPELNLHPILQRHLLRYLCENTTNQYLISTHSAHLLDTPGATIFRIENESGWTVATRVAGPEGHLDICEDLGYRPSDLLQTNAVIWVEGPSDRIYLLNWLKSVAPEFLEGLHFSVMFYGGSLLRHLTADDRDLRDWIELRKLNQNLVVIMDSDRTPGKAKVSDTKNRVIKELESGPRGVAWLTDARTIESYVPAEILRKAICVVHPSARPEWDGKKLTNPFEGVDEPDKVAVAKQVDLLGVLPTDVHDLRSALDRIRVLLRKANSAIPLPKEA